MAPGFIEQHGLWSDDQRRHAEELKYRIEKDDIQLIRVAWADPHGASRAKTVTVPAFAAALTTGYNINVATTTLNSANARTFASFTRGGGMGLDEMTGSPNLTIVPDPGDVPAAAVGAEGRLDPVRRILQQRRAVSFLAAAGAAPADQAARRARAGLRGRARDRVVPPPHRRPAPHRRAHRHSGRARPAGRRPSRPSRDSPITPKPTWT